MKYRVQHQSPMENARSNSSVIFSHTSLESVKFCIDQLDEQIKNCDYQLENSWKDLELLCEDIVGKKFDGTLEAVDELFTSQILDNSVCSVTDKNAVGAMSKDLLKLLKENPGCENDIFQKILLFQFKEGLNFPITITETGKQHFGDDEHFNELFACIQKFYLDELLQEEDVSDITETDPNISVAIIPSTTSATVSAITGVIAANHFIATAALTTSLPTTSNKDSSQCEYLTEFMKERRLEYKCQCFQNLCLLSSLDHGLILYANSKSLQLKPIIENLKLVEKLNINDFIECGKQFLSMFEDDVSFLKFCIDDGDVISFASTVYLDPFLEAIEIFFAKLIKSSQSSNLSQKNRDKSETSSKSSLCAKSGLESGQSVQLLNPEVLSDLLMLIGWLVQVDDQLVRIQNSFLKCVAQQEQNRNISRRDAGVELKSALKGSTSASKKKANMENFSYFIGAFNWYSIFMGLSGTLLKNFESALQQCSTICKDDISSEVIPASLQHKKLYQSVAYKKSIDLAKTIDKFLCLSNLCKEGKDGNAWKLFVEILNDSISKHDQFIRSMVKKDTTVNTLLILLSGTKFLESFLEHCVKLYFHHGDVLFSNKLHYLSVELNDLIVIRFTEILILSTFHDNDDDFKDENDRCFEPSYSIQNWRMKMIWLRGEVSRYGSAEMSYSIVTRCTQTSVEKLVWYYSSIHITKEKLDRFICDILSILNFSLDILLQSCRTSEEIIDACPNDGPIHEIHTSCGAFLTILMVSACPLDVLKKMYEKVSNKSRCDASSTMGHNCQWIRLIKPDWSVPGKTRLTQLDRKVAIEIIFDLFQYDSFCKQHLLLQLMLIFENRFIVLLLQHLFSYQQSFKDMGGSNDLQEDVNLIICSILNLLINCQIFDEHIFDRVLLNVAKIFSSSCVGTENLFKNSSALIEFCSDAVEPFMAGIMWEAIQEHEESVLPSFSSASNTSYFSQERLFCGCKPSSSINFADNKNEEDVILVKIFMNVLFRKFYSLPFHIMYFCFQFDQQFRKDKLDSEPLYLKVLVKSLSSAVNKMVELKAFKAAHEEKFKSIASSLESHVSCLSSSNEWFKDCILKFNGLAKEILKERKDENDPVLNTSPDDLPTDAFQMLLQSVRADKIGERSINILTAFTIDNLEKLKIIFNNAGCVPEHVDQGSSGSNFRDKEFDLVNLNFAHFKNVLTEKAKEDSSERNSFTANCFNPFQIFEKYKTSSKPFINWELCLEMDLGLTEINFSNLIGNRAEFDDDAELSLNDDSKAFVEVLKQKHLRKLS